MQKIVHVHYQPDNPADNRMPTGFSPQLPPLPVRPHQVSWGSKGPSHLRLETKASQEKWSGLAQGGGCWAWLVNIAEFGPWGSHIPCPSSNSQHTRMAGVGPQELRGAELTYGQGHCGPELGILFPIQIPVTDRLDFTTAGISLLQEASNVFSGGHIQACLCFCLLAFMVL